MDPFGTYLKRKRLDHNLALREVAAAAGASLPDVSAWENGRRRPKPGAQFLAMMNAYRIPNDAEAVVSALCEIPVLEPVRVPEALIHVSWAHDEALGDACGCNECRLAWFNTHACRTCSGEGLQPGTPEKPEDPREVARHAPPTAIQ